MGKRKDRKQKPKPASSEQSDDAEVEEGPIIDETEKPNDASRRRRNY